MRIRKPSPALIVACIALAVALSGTGYAVTALPRGSVGTAQLKSNAVTSQKVKNGSLLRGDFKSGQLPAGATGPQGPAGPAAAQGPAGAPNPNAGQLRPARQSRLACVPPERCARRAEPSPATTPTPASRRMRSGQRRSPPTPSARRRSSPRQSGRREVDPHDSGSTMRSARHRHRRGHERRDRRRHDSGGGRRHDQQRVARKQHRDCELHPHECAHWQRGRRSLSPREHRRGDVERSLGTS